MSTNRCPATRENDRDPCTDTETYQFGHSEIVVLDPATGLARIDQPDGSERATLDDNTLAALEEVSRDG